VNANIINAMVKQAQRINRLHNLVRLKATGSPKDCAEKLKISVRQFYRLIDLMKELGAPIYFDLYANSYTYEHEVKWSFGFESILKTHTNDRLSN
jgi:hypothetical protein